ncbi:hypothetical protein RI367_006025 [Sorochytrium milnesiophthora]
MRVYSRLLGLHYSLPLASPYTLAYCFVAAVVPFLIGYYSRSFFVKVGSFIEWPRNVFTNELLVVVNGVSTMDVASLLAPLAASANTSSAPQFTLASSIAQNVQPPPFSIVFSTNASYNERALLFGGDVRIPTVQSRENDPNRSGEYTFLDLDMQVPLNDNEQVQSVELLLGFTSYFSYYYTFQLNGAAYLALAPTSQSQSLAEVKFTGSLELVQAPIAQVPLSYDAQQTMSANANVTRPFDILVNQDVDENAGDAQSLASVMAAYTQLPIRMCVLPSSLQTEVKQPRARGQPLHIHARINYPPVRVYYTPSSAEVLKFAWVQYFCLGVAVWYLCRRVTVLALRLGLLKARATFDRLPIPSAPATTISAPYTVHLPRLGGSVGGSGTIGGGGGVKSIT